MNYMKFIHPFTCLVAGPKCSGKTVLVTDILKNSIKVIDNIKQPKICWAYGVWQKGYNDFDKKISLHEGLPDEQYLLSNKINIIVIDDLMNELGDNFQLVNLFTKGSHHLNISVFFIVQNIFHKSKYMRNISLNCHYLLLMKNPRDRSQIMCLARQLYPTKSKKFIESYEEATNEPYSYIKIDLRATTPDKYRLQTNIIPGKARFKVFEIENVKKPERISTKTQDDCKFERIRSKKWITL